MVHKVVTNIAMHGLGANLSLKDKARYLRRNQTDAEKLLWIELRGKKQSGMYFRRQHPYGIYILDFFCFKANLAIEVDGMIHLKRRIYDVERTKYLEASGLNVIRFSNKDIETRIDWVLEKINSNFKEGIKTENSPLNRKIGKADIISP